MATQFTAPQNSFVQIAGTAFVNDILVSNKDALPLSSLANLAFQFKMSTLRPFPVGIPYKRLFIAVPTKIDTDCITANDNNAPQYLGISGIGLNDPVETNDEDVAFFSFAINTGHANKPVYDFDVWNTYQSPEKRIKVGDCFYFQIYEYFKQLNGTGVIGGYPICCTAPFFRVAHTEFNSVIEYSNNEPSNSFIYSKNIYAYNFQSGSNVLVPTQNRVELPMYLEKPQMKETTEQYQRYDGTYKKLFERLDETFILNVDEMIYAHHRCLMVALGSDTIEIQNDFFKALMRYNIPTTFSAIKKEDYTINWQEITRHGTAPATTTLYSAKPINLFNPSCK